MYTYICIYICICIYIYIYHIALPLVLAAAGKALWCHNRLARLVTEVSVMAQCGRGVSHAQPRRCLIIRG